MRFRSGRPLPFLMVIFVDTVIPMKTCFVGKVWRNEESRGFAGKEQLLIMHDANGELASWRSPIANWNRRKWVPTNRRQFVIASENMYKICGEEF